MIIYYNCSRHNIRSGGFVGEGRRRNSPPSISLSLSGQSGCKEEEMVYKELSSISLDISGTTNNLMLTGKLTLLSLVDTPASYWHNCFKLTSQPIV